MFPRSAPLLRRCTTLLRVALIADLVDEILTNKCPRCGQVFLDFSGCFALSCASCPCKFCAWCFEDCGDALGASGNRPTGCHLHVSQCPHKPADTGAYFAPTALFDAQNQARRKRTLRMFIRDAVEPPLRDAVLMSVVSDLNDPSVGLGPFLQELVGAGEADIALVTLIETLPQTLTTEFVDSVEAHYAGSGDYVEPQALTAVTKYRQQLTA